MKGYNLGFFIAGLLFLGFFTSSGCVRQVTERIEPASVIEWPGPPEEPRLRFIKTVSIPEDLGIKASAMKGFLEYIAGKQDRSLLKPYGIAVDTAGKLYVVDTGGKVVHVYDETENHYYQIGKKEPGFSSPIDIAISSENGRVYVSDSEQGVVKIFSDKGRTYEGEIGRKVFERPTGLAVNKNTSELLIVDTLRATVFRYDLKEHNLKGKFGENGFKPGKFHFPTNIHVKPDGTILVSDALNFRIQLFSAEGKFLSMFGEEGDRPGYFTRPRGVGADSDGNIYVVDALFDNVQVFDSMGRLLIVFGVHGSGYGEFWLPTGIHIDSNDRIYVSDSYNKRIQIFQYLKKGGPQQ